MHREGSVVEVHRINGLDDGLPSGAFGSELRSIDIQGDGIEDVIVGAPLKTTLGMGTGEIYQVAMVEGGNRVDCVVRATDSLRSVGGRIAVADVSGDTIHDVIIGCPESDDGQGVVAVARNANRRSGPTLSRGSLRAVLSRASDAQAVELRALNPSGDTNAVLVVSSVIQQPERLGRSCFSEVPVRLWSWEYCQWSVAMGESAMRWLSDADITVTMMFLELDSSEGCCRASNPLRLPFRGFPSSSSIGS
jgi:hypothetical protein